MIREKCRPVEANAGNGATSEEICATTCSTRLNPHQTRRNPGVDRTNVAARLAPHPVLAIQRLRAGGPERRQASDQISLATSPALATSDDPPKLVSRFGLRHRGARFERLVARVSRIRQVMHQKLHAIARIESVRPPRKRPARSDSNRRELKRKSC